MSIERLTKLQPSEFSTPILGYLRAFTVVMSELVETSYE
jgi:hypothetical protein